MVCPSVCGDNPLALANGLSPGYLTYMWTNMEEVLKSIFGPAHEILVLIAYAQKSQINAIADVPIKWARA